jgi:hypothetical protein
VSSYARMCPPTHSCVLLRTLLVAGGHMHKDAHAREETSFQHRMQAWQHAQELEKKRETQEKAALLRRSQVLPPLIFLFK